jgi:hypothetical protein
MKARGLRPGWRRSLPPGFEGGGKDKVMGQPKQAGFEKVQHFQGRQWNRKQVRLQVGEASCEARSCRYRSARFDEGKVALEGPSGKDFFDDVARNVRQAHVAATIPVGQALVVQAQEVEDGGV